jgi:hypothetical protein
VVVTGVRPRLDKAALFRDLGYRPHAGQQAVHRSRALRRVLACGVRWGKTHVGVHEVAAALLEPRLDGSLGWVVGPDHTVGDRILKLARRALERACPHRIVDARGHLLRERNLAGGVSEAQGRSAENPASLLGESLDWLVVDEAARIKDEVWDAHLAQRLVERRGWALVLSTPRGPGWFYDAYRRGRSDEDADYDAWTGPTWANPRIDREAIEAERRRLDPDTFLQEFEGKFVGPGIPRCETCLWPRPEHPPIPVLRGREKLARCGDCGHLLGVDGLALGFDDGGGAGVVEHSIRLVARRRGGADPSLLLDVLSNGREGE